MTSTSPFARLAKTVDSAKEREQSEQAAAAARRKAEQERAAAEALARTTTRFINGFVDALEKLGSSDRPWKAERLAKAYAYAEALAQVEDTPLPDIDENDKTLLHSKFAFGLVLRERNGAPVPANYFNGQRQEWFPALYADKLIPKETPKSPSKEATKVALKDDGEGHLVEEPVTGLTQSLGSVIDINKAKDLKSAVTPKSKKDRRPKSVRTSSQKASVS